MHVSDQRVCGLNQYDGSDEFWVVTKETGRRQESQSYEELQRKESEVRDQLVEHRGQSPRESCGT